MVLGCEKMSNCQLQPLQPYGIKIRMDFNLAEKEQNKYHHNISNCLRM